MAIPLLIKTLVLQTKWGVENTMINMVESISLCLAEYLILANYPAILIMDSDVARSVMTNLASNTSSFRESYRIICQEVATSIAGQLHQLILKWPNKEEISETVRCR